MGTVDAGVLGGHCSVGKINKEFAWNPTRCGSSMGLAGVSPYRSMSLANAEGPLSSGPVRSTGEKTIPNQFGTSQEHAPIHQPVKPNWADFAGDFHAIHTPNGRKAAVPVKW